MTTLITGPTVITTPGHYTLAASFSTSGHGIVVACSGVTIDFAGHSISGSGGPLNTAYGVSAFGQTDVHILNGKISGFQYGVYLSDYIDSKPDGNLTTTSHSVVRMEISDCTFRGIRIEGHGNEVLSCRISSIGGTSLYEDAYAFGIEIFGRAVIQRNVIQDVRGNGESDVGEGVGIGIAQFGTGSVLRDNIISNSEAEFRGSYGGWPGESRSTYGIWVGGDGSSEIFVDNNTIINFIYGVTFKRTVAGSYADNVVFGATVPFYTPFDNDFSRVIDLGGNFSDVFGDETLIGRFTAGDRETAEFVYLSPLPRWTNATWDRYQPDLASGNQLVTGGPGQFLDLWGVEGPVHINLQAGTVSGAGLDWTLSGFTAAQGGRSNDYLVGSHQADMLSGADGADSLWGGEGDDYLFGGTENDYLNGGDGNDVLVGGQGTDTLVGGRGNDVYVIAHGISLSDTVIEFEGEGFDEIRTYASSVVLPDHIEALTFLGGWSFHGIGNAANNVMVGGLGTNILEGGLGDDLLIGGRQGDFLDGGEGADVLVGGGGDDTYFVENVDDVVDESTGSGHDTVIAGVSYILRGSGIEVLRAVEGTDPLQLTGNAEANSIFGNAGSNRLDGGDGNDMLSGGDGADELIGGAGLDYARYDDAVRPGLIVSLRDVSRNTGAARGDTFSSIEGLVLGYGDDTGEGDDQANWLYGMAGNDQLFGFGGNDTLDGGAGDDILDGGDGADVLIGGDGVDTVTYASAAAGVTLFLSGGVNSGGAAGDVLSGVENLIGSAFADRLVGDAGSNRLDGGDGNDMLSGGDGADELIGGAGLDYARYDDAVRPGLIVSLRDVSRNTGAARGDTFSSIEGLVLGYGDDTGEGDDQANWLYGMAGNDQLFGFGGNDTLDGGAGDDILDGGDGRDNLWGGVGSDVFYFDQVRPTAQADIVRDFEHGSDKIWVNFEGFGSSEPPREGWFVSGPLANDARPQLLWDADHQALWFDSDGTGAGVAVMIAQFTGAVTLDASDFVWADAMAAGSALSKDSEPIDWIVKDVHALAKLDDSIICFDTTIEQVAWDASQGLPFRPASNSAALATDWDWLM